jgi:hypothetical protein
MANRGGSPFEGERRQDYQDYVERFRLGPQGVSDEEAVSRYGQVAPQLPPDVYQQSAQDVFAQLTPEQRMQLGRALIQSARQNGQDFPDVNGDGIDDRLQDPDFLAQKATQVQQQQPGLLGRLLGEGAAPPVRRTAGGAFGSPLTRGILGGIAAAGLMNMLSGPRYYGGGLFGPPVMGGFFGGGPIFMGGFGGEGMYEEGFAEGTEGDFGGGDFGGGDFGGGDFGGGDF